MKLLTNLGLDTGFTKEDYGFHIDNHSQGGLEAQLGSDKEGMIMKSPAFMEDISQFDEYDVKHIFFCIRDLMQVAKSRVYQEENNTRKIQGDIPGGLWNINYMELELPLEEKQALAIMDTISAFLVEVSMREIPITFINYPMMYEDSAYLYRKLSVAFEEAFMHYDLDFYKFKEICKETIDLSLIHTY